MKKIMFLLMLLIPAALFAQGGDGELGGIWGILTAVFGVLTSVLGVAFKKFRKKFGQVLKLLKEAVDVGTLATQTGEKIKAALEDGKLSQEEILDIAEDFEKYPQELSEVKTALKSLTGKDL